MVHFYFGFGKGKTTAAMGQALRAAGCGKKVLIVQFLKNTPSGEITALEHVPGVRVLRGQAGDGFTFQMSQEQRKQTRRMHDQHLREGIRAVEAGEVELLVLDEAGDALTENLLDEEMLRGFLIRMGHCAEIVITGHKRIDWLAQQADYLTEMVKHRHPYDHGVTARRGVEF